MKTLFLFLASLSLTACFEYKRVPLPEDEYLEGEVISESGYFNMIENDVSHIKPGLFDNGGYVRSVALSQSPYVISVKVKEDVYTIEVIPHENKPIASLAHAIKVGTRIRFPRVTYDYPRSPYSGYTITEERYDTYPHFASDNVGNLFTYRISIIK